MSPGSLLAGDSGINLSRDTDSRTAVRGRTSQVLNVKVLVAQLIMCKQKISDGAAANFNSFLSGCN